jgi:hypothetical protein
MNADEMLKVYAEIIFTKEELDLIIWQMKQIEDELGMDITLLINKAELQKELVKTENEWEIDCVDME